MVILVIGVLVIGVTKGSSIIKKAKLTSAQSLTRTSPVALSKNLVVWFETTLEKSFTDSERVDTALGATGTISTWKNLNLQSYPVGDATQATDTNKPRYVADGINGLPVLNFDGVDDYFDLPDGTIPYGDSSYTMIVVAEIVDKNKSHQVLITSGATTANTANALFIYYLSPHIRSVWTSRDLNAKTTSFVNNTPFIISSDYNSSTGGSEIYHNGVLEGGNTRANRNSGSVNNGIGGFSSGAAHLSGKFKGNIAEIIVFDRRLTNDERESVESYLSTKWNINLT